MALITRGELDILGGARLITLLLGVQDGVIFMILNVLPRSCGRAFQVYNTYKMGCFVLSCTVSFQNEDKTVTFVVP